MADDEERKVDEFQRRDGMAFDGVVGRGEPVELAEESDRLRMLIARHVESLVPANGPMPSAVAIAESCRELWRQAGIGGPFAPPYDATQALVLDRAEWSKMRDERLGPPIQGATMTARLREARLFAEVMDDQERIVSYATVIVGRDATYLSVGELHLLVANGAVAVVAGKPPHPIEQWEVLWQGALPAPPEES